MYYVKKYTAGIGPTEFQDKLNEMAKGGAKLVGLTTIGSELLLVIEDKNSYRTGSTSIGFSGRDHELLSRVKRVTDMGSMPTSTGIEKVAAKQSPSKSKRRK